MLILLRGAPFVFPDSAKSKCSAHHYRTDREAHDHSFLAHALLRLLADAHLLRIERRVMKIKANDPQLRDISVAGEQIALLIYLSRLSAIGLLLDALLWSV